MRLPSGDKVSRRFNATDPLQALLDFVALQGYPRHNLQLNFPLREVSARRLRTCEHARHWLIQFEQEDVVLQLPFAAVGSRIDHDDEGGRAVPERHRLCQAILNCSACGYSPM